MQKRGVFETTTMRTGGAAASTAKKLTFGQHP